MTFTYPMSEELLAAIATVFSEPQQGLQFLEQRAKPVPDPGHVRHEDPPYVERVQLLRQTLESWVILLANQQKEFEAVPSWPFQPSVDVEKVRIRAEVVATLLCLRELRSHFREAF